MSRRLEGLVGETTYHWRLVLTDANGEAKGVDNTFVYLPRGAFEVEAACGNDGLRGESNVNPTSRQPLSTELPDCRAYEMVSPAHKNGALLVPALLGLLPQVGAGGEHVIASSLVCFDSAQSCTGDRASKGPPFEFARTSSGWEPHPLTPPASEFELNTVWGYSPDAGLVLYSSPVASGISDEFYIREPSGMMEGIGPIAEARPYREAESLPHLATSDLSHLVYMTKHAEWNFDASEREGVYEYVGQGNAKPMLVGVSGGPGSMDLISICNTSLGSGAGEGMRQALSAEGRVVYFTADKGQAACPGGSGTNAANEVPVDEVYARIDGEGPDAHTVALSEPRAPETSTSTPPDKNCTTVECQKNITEPGKWRDALLAGASEDGSKAVFMSTQQLTDAASQDPSGDTARHCSETTGPRGCNLYLYDFSAPSGHNLLDLSAGDSSGPRVQGVVAVSGDGSHVYFVAKGALTGKNRAGLEPEEGADNLYGYERDVLHPSGRLTFIATLPGNDSHNTREEFAESEQWDKQAIAASVTTDGRVFVFTSHGALTADSTLGRGPAQVYRYDAEREELLRVSIGERGFDDNGTAGDGEARLANTGGLVVPARRDLSMSSDGSMVFFQSPVGLTPGALNDVSVNGGATSRDLAENIYEWEKNGRGGCTQMAGCVHLITDGRDVSEGVASGPTATSSSVELWGSDRTGENVFFTTADPLVPADTDSQLDIYDARVGGGFPAPMTPESCQGETCRGVGSQEEALAPFASSALTGAGNLVETIKPPPKPPGKTAMQIRAEKLAKALKACRKVRSKKRRLGCERLARRRYGPVRGTARSRSHTRGHPQRRAAIQ
jgi:hypothetical protein